MKSHWELFQEYYKKATDDVRAFIDYNVLNTLLTKIIKGRDITITPEEKRDLLYIINLSILTNNNVPDLDKYSGSLNLDDVDIQEIINEVTLVFVSANDYKQYGSAHIAIDVRNSLLANASDDQKFLIRDPLSILQLYAIAEKHHLYSQKLYAKFAITIGDIVLGFYNIADTEPLLIQELGITPEAAQALTPDVLEFLAPLSDPNWQPPVDEEVMNNASEDTNISKDDNGANGDNQEMDISQSEQTATNEHTEINTTAQPMRTMQQDMARSPQRPEFEPMSDDTPVYSSQQPTNEREVPSYTKPAEPTRWETEQD